ncbi:hypothetical protein Ahy_B06g082119 isoform C [Arachis hypogaea]|nr:hypothetical protein Ahy_B06g082119 isoform C [Arachis hypogaea]
MVSPTAVRWRHRWLGFASLRVEEERKKSGEEEKRSTEALMKTASSHALPSSSSRTAVVGRHLALSRRHRWSEVPYNESRMPRYEDKYGNTRLYVGRLASRTRSRDLERVFSRYGR